MTSFYSRPMRSRLILLLLLYTWAPIQAAAQSGIFVVPPQYSTGLGPVAIASGDFNGDGILDLAVVNLCSAANGSCTPGSVSILLGNGNGTFQTRVDYPVDDAPASVAIAERAPLRQ